MTHWARDRESGRIPLERVVQMQSRDTARFVGLHDRGELKLGQRADINVIDFSRLQLRHLELVADLPAGGERLIQRAEGYIATLVAGEVIASQGQITSARPGRLVRSGRHGSASR